MPRTDGQVIAKGPGKWQVRIQLNDGKRGTKTVTVNGTKRDAQRRKRELEEERDAGLYRGAARQPLGQYLDEWLADWVERRGLRPKTVEGYQRDVDILKRGLGGKALADLTTVELERHFVALGKQLSVDAAYRATRTLRTALRDAVRLGVVPHNPAAACQVPRPKKKAKRVLGAEEAAVFYGAAVKHSRTLPFAIMLELGLRPAETYGLKWEDIEWTEGTVTIRRAVVYLQKPQRWEFGEPKTEAGKRTIDASQGLLGRLKRHRAEQAEWRLRAAEFTDHGLVFPRETGEPVNPDSMRAHVFQPLLRRLGLPDSIRVYDLRHSCASLLVQQGEALPVVAERLGHTDQGFTLATYCHALPGSQKAATARLSALLKSSEASS